jgi:hypothetical protein
MSTATRVSGISGGLWSSRWPRGTRSSISCQSRRVSAVSLYSVASGLQTRLQRRSLTYDFVPFQLKLRCQSQLRAIELMVASWAMMGGGDGSAQLRPLAADRDSSAGAARPGRPTPDAGMPHRRRPVAAPAKTACPRACQAMRGPAVTRLATQGRRRSSRPAGPGSQENLSCPLPPMGPICSSTRRSRLQPP